MAVSEKPILPVLADIIAKSATGDLTLLVTEYGKTSAGFGAWFRNRCDEAGLRHCTIAPRTAYAKPVRRWPRKPVRRIGN